MYRTQRYNCSHCGQFRKQTTTTTTTTPPKTTWDITAIRPGTWQLSELFASKYCCKQGQPPSTMCTHFHIVSLWQGCHKYILWIRVMYRHNLFFQSISSVVCPIGRTECKRYAKTKSRTKQMLYGMLKSQDSRQLRHHEPSLTSTSVLEKFEILVNPNCQLNQNSTVMQTVLDRKLEPDHRTGFHSRSQNRFSFQITGESTCTEQMKESIHETSYRYCWNRFRIQT